MSRWKTAFTVIVCTVCATSACSKARADTASAATSDPGGASASPGADTGGVAVDCSKVFSPNDLAGLLKGPGMTHARSGSAACSDFGNHDLVDVNVRIVGDAT